MRKNRNCVKYVGEKIAIALISRAYCRYTGGPESSDLWKSHISIFHQTKERKTYYLHLQFFWSRQSTNKCGAGYLWGKGSYSLRPLSLFLWKYPPSPPTSELRWPPENHGRDNLRGNFEKIVVVKLYWTERGVTFCREIINNKFFHPIDPRPQHSRNISSDQRKPPIQQYQRRDFSRLAEQDF